MSTRLACGWCPSRVRSVANGRAQRDEAAVSAGSTEVCRRSAGADPCGGGTPASPTGSGSGPCPCPAIRRERPQRSGIGGRSRRMNRSRPSMRRRRPVQERAPAAPTRLGSRSCLRPPIRRERPRRCGTGGRSRRMGPSHSSVRHRTTAGAGVRSAGAARIEVVSPSCDPSRRAVCRVDGAAVLVGWTGPPSTRGHGAGAVRDGDGVGSLSSASCRSIHRERPRRSGTGGRSRRMNRDEPGPSMRRSGAGRLGTAMRSGGSVRFGVLSVDPSRTAAPVRVGRPFVPDGPDRHRRVAVQRWQCGTAMGSGR